MKCWVNPGFVGWFLPRFLLELQLQAWRQNGTHTVNALECAYRVNACMGESMPESSIP